MNVEFTPVERIIATCMIVDRHSNIPTNETVLFSRDGHFVMILQEQHTGRSELYTHAEGILKQKYEKF